MSLLVSVIITTHNRIDLLPRAIDSVLHQTYKNIECIVVSDNSTDGTEEYCQQMNEIIYISIPANKSKGGNYARNLGIKKAKGEYIAFLDDDDYWKYDKIQKQVDLIEEKNCGLVYCSRELEIVKDNQVTEFISISLSNNDCGNLSRRVLYTIPTTTSAILVKRDLLLKAGMFDEALKFWQETELSIRLAQLTPYYFVNEPLLVYRINRNDVNRLTNKYYEWWTSIKYILKKHKTLYKQLSFEEKRWAAALIISDAKNRASVCDLNFQTQLLALLYKIIMIPELIHGKRKIAQ